MGRLWRGVARRLPTLRRAAGRRGPQSVRVRITLVAAVVTATAMGAGAWVFVRAVEDSQRGEIRRDTEDVLAEVAARLEAGEAPECAVQSIDLTTGLIRVTAEDGTQTFAVVAGGGSYAESMESRRDPGATTPAGGEQQPNTSTCGEDLPDVGDQAPAAPGDVLVPSAEREEGESSPATGPVNGQAGGGAGGDGATGADADGGSGASSSGVVVGEGSGTGPAGSGSGESDATRVDGTTQDVPGAPEPGGGAAPGSEDLLSSYDLETMTRPVETPDGTVMLTVGAPVDQVGRSIDAVRRALLVGMPLLLGLVVAAAWWLVGRALRPVEAIRTEAEAIGGSTLDRRVPAPDSGDEIGRLAQTMNAMLERLEASARRQRQFVADASHELRSPLSAIRTDLEVALLEGDRGDWRESVRASLQEEARLEALIADLLILAADDEDAPAAPSTPVDVAALAAEEAARPRRLPVRCEGSASEGGADDPGLVTTGSARQLRRVVANLLDNAVRHARSEVTVTVEQVGTQVRLTVDDDGPGIPVADRERVFERFTRLDDGRTREEGGSGLGLAVVRSIVHRHHGTVHVTANPRSGARVVVTLPAHCLIDETFAP
jgi:signal transduction histidine kinase